MTTEQQLHKLGVIMERFTTFRVNVEAASKALANVRHSGNYSEMMTADEVAQISETIDLLGKLSDRARFANVMKYAQNLPQD